MSLFNKDINDWLKTPASPQPLPQEGSLAGEVSAIIHHKLFIIG